MRVFVSWSGELSHEYAQLINDWLPSVLQSVQTYVSSSDIKSGSRWSVELAKELEAHSYGILCLTHMSKTAPWVNFEAGALSKAVGDSHVVPLLFDLKKSDVDYPLAQFQMRLTTRDDMLALLVDINSASATPIEQHRLEAIFGVWWPRFEESLAKIRAKNIEETERPKEDENSKVLEEILDVIRAQQRLLTSPEQLLPPQYLAHALQRYTRSEQPNLRLLDQIATELDNLVELTKQMRGRIAPAALRSILSMLEACMYLSRGTPARIRAHVDDVASRAQSLLRAYEDVVEAAAARPAPSDDEDEIPF